MFRVVVTGLQESKREFSTIKEPIVDGGYLIVSELIDGTTVITPISLATTVKVDVTSVPTPMS